MMLIAAAPRSPERQTAVQSTTSLQDQFEHVRNLYLSRLSQPHKRTSAAAALLYQSMFTDRGGLHRHGRHLLFLFVFHLCLGEA